MAGVFPRIESLQTLDGLELRVRFDDGRVVVYDVAEDVRDIPSYAPLQTLAGLFEQAKVDRSRTCVYWNDEIDLPSDAIYEYGRQIAPASSKAVAHASRSVNADEGR